MSQEGRQIMKNTTPETKNIEKQELLLPAEVSIPKTQSGKRQLLKTGEGKNIYTIDDKKFISLALQMGFKPPQIARIFGVSRNAIIGLNTRQGGNQAGMLLKYSFTDQEKNDFTAEYGRPESLKNKIWTEARRAASDMAKKVRRLTKKGMALEQISITNSAIRNFEGASNKIKFIEIMFEEARLAYENESTRKIIEQKFNLLILLLRGVKREKFGTTTINGITLKSIATVRRKPPITADDLQLIPTRLIEIENISAFTQKEKEIQKGLWYLVKIELEKIQNGKNSRLSEFLILDAENIPTNRLAISYKQTLHIKIASQLKLSSPVIVNTDLFPPQSGENFKVEYNENEFKSLEPLQIAEVVNTDTHENYTNKNSKKTIHRAGRLSELSREERAERILLENFIGIQAHGRGGDSSGPDRLDLLENNSVNLKPRQITGPTNKKKETE